MNENLVQNILKSRIEDKEITKCKTCNKYFAYIPQKKFCDNCIKERRSADYRKYYQKNKDRILANKKKHYYENQEAQIERKRKYREANKDKIKESNHKQYLKRKENKK